MTNNNNTQQNTRPNPFAPKNNQQNQRPNPFASSSNNNNKSSSRFGSSRFSRFGGSVGLEWTVKPMTPQAVRISLEGLGDPFHRLLGKPMNPDYGDPAKVIEALQQDSQLAEELSELLDKAWQSYDFKGAALLYPWNTSVRKAYTEFMYPLPPQPEQQQSDDEDEYTDDETDDTPVGKKPEVTTYRAIDILLVFNVLARTRSHVLIANTPLALEPGFLSETYICDDPRIVALALGTGSIAESWSQ